MQRTPRIFRDGQTVIYTKEDSWGDGLVLGERYKVVSSNAGSVRINKSPYWINSDSFEPAPVYAEKLESLRKKFNLNSIKKYILGAVYTDYDAPINLNNRKSILIKRYRDGRR